uniref:Calcineurin-like phosphoesterase domain-containing protein n=1 Tax=Arcella intermedia TaxID=1963864 RepID=A0A6B2LC37_9EUKA
MSELAVLHLNRLHPRFAIICGDFVHHLPEIYPQFDPSVRERQIRDIKAVYSKVHESVPLICVCGNHDVGNVPNATTINRYKNDWGDDYFSFWVDGLCGIAINSSVIHAASKAAPFFEEQLAWLERTLQDAATRNPTHIVIFSHHPFFLKKAEETEEDLDPGDDYFVIKKEVRLQYLELFKRFNVHFIFAGHLHRNAVAHSEEYGITNVTTTAVGRQLGSDQSGFRVVWVNQDSIKHTYFSFDQLNSLQSL